MSVGTFSADEVLSFISLEVAEDLAPVHLLFSPLFLSAGKLWASRNSPNVLMTSPAGSPQAESKQAGMSSVDEIPTEFLWSDSFSARTELF